MADISTEYCGLQLKSPLMASASSLTGDLATAKQLQSAGAAGIVLPSLFEEELQHNPQRLHAYLDKIKSFKDSLDIPVVASLNGVSDAGWLEHSESLEQAGCDALELNVYYIAADASESSDQIERKYINLVYKLRSQIRIPISVKLTHQFSSVSNMVKRLEGTGIDGVVLFNRFYQPDIDLESLTVTPTLSLSDASESLLRVRWIAMLRDQVALSLCASGGFHCVDDIVKALLVGADCVQLCSVLFQSGVDEVQRLLAGIQHWLESSKFKSVKELQGQLSYANLADPSGYERQNYLQVLESNN